MSLRDAHLTNVWECRTGATRQRARAGQVRPGWLRLRCTCCRLHRHRPCGPQSTILPSSGKTHFILPLPLVIDSLQSSAQHHPYPLRIASLTCCQLCWLWPAVRHASVVHCPMQSRGHHPECAELPRPEHAGRPEGLPGLLLQFLGLPLLPPGRCRPAAPGACSQFSPSVLVSHYVLPVANLVQTSEVRFAMSEDPDACRSGVLA